jgi:hypothetical protein
MSYGTDHCSKVCICSSKEVKRNRDAIVETYGRKSDLAELHPNRLARPEGFEPPTLRSEVSFNPESPELRQKTRAILQALGDSPSLLFHADSPRCGYKDRYRTVGSHG